MKKLIFRHWFLHLQIIICIIVAAVLQVLSSLVLTTVLDALVGARFTLALWWLAVMLFLWAGYSVFAYLKKVRQAKAYERMQTDLYEGLVHSLMKMNLKEFDARENGDYISMFTNDMHQITTNVFDSFYSVLSSAAVLIFSFLAIAYLHVYLAIYTVFAFLAIYFVPKIFDKRNEKCNLDLSEENAGFTSHIKDQIAGFSVYELCCKKDIFQSRVMQGVRKLLSFQFRYQRFQALIACLIDYMSVVCQLGSAVVTAILIGMKYVSVGAFSSQGNLTGMFYNSATVVIASSVRLRASRRRLREPVYPPKEKEGNASGEGNRIQREISVRKLDFSYNDKPLFHDFSAEFVLGGKYAVLGESGCGKSTLLKLLLKIVECKPGQIFADNRDICDWDIRDVLESIAYIEQSPYLFQASIADNITLFQQADKEFLNGILLKCNLQEFVQGLERGLHTVLGENAGTISGGQKQRIAIARALFQKKKIIIMDEATSALDKRNAEDIEKRLLSDPELTVILVSHRLSEEIKAMLTKCYYL